MRERIVMLGGGVVGGYVGGHLALHGHDLTLIDFWHEHVDAILVATPEPQAPQKKFGPAHGRRRDEFCAINTGAQWLTVSRISATSSTDRAVVDPVSCRLGA